MSYTCPECGATSHHPVDERVGWCGRCNKFTGGKTRGELIDVAEEMCAERDPAYTGLVLRLLSHPEEET